MIEERVISLGQRKGIYSVTTVDRGAKLVFPSDGNLLSNWYSLVVVMLGDIEFCPLSDWLEDNLIGSPLRRNERLSEGDRKSVGIFRPD